MVALDDLCFEPAFRFSRTEMRRYAEAKRARVVIASYGETLAGFCILHIEGTPGVPVGYVVTLDVAPAMRRRGVATQLMLSVGELAWQDACRTIMLHVDIRNAAAIGFYERLGFRGAGSVNSFYGPGRDALVLRAELPFDGGSTPGISG